MDIKSQLETVIKNLGQKLPQVDSTQGEKIILSELAELATEAEWNNTHHEWITFLCKKIDITGKVYSSYDNGKPASGSQPLSDPDHLDLVAAFVFKDLMEKAENNPKSENVLKRYNTLLKAQTAFQPTWLKENADFQTCLEQIADANLKAAAILDPTLIKVTTEDKVAPETKFKTIPLSVLFYEGPIARAYLETLYSLGLKPQKIIHLISAKDISSKKEVGKWLPKSFRIKYADSIQRSKIHFWPQKIAKESPDLHKNILDCVTQSYAFDESTLRDAQQLHPLEKYCDTVDHLLISGLNDPVLAEYFQAEPQSALLFTGGGIVPKKLFSFEHIKLIHIHPGYLPYIRGADCCLWSILLCGHASASCFYMDPGIDTGDIIKACWLPELGNLASLDNHDLKTQYRAMYSFIDPWIRAYVLRAVLKETSEFFDLPSTAQTESGGTTYHFMHPDIQERVFRYCSRT